MALKDFEGKSHASERDNIAFHAYRIESALQCLNMELRCNRDFSFLLLDAYRKKVLRYSKHLSRIIKMEIENVKQNTQGKKQAKYGRK